MPAITLNFTAGVATRLFDALAARKGYNPATDGTKAVFADKMIRQMLVAEVRAYESDRDAKAAGSAADISAETQIIITSSMS